MIVCMTQQKNGTCSKRMDRADGVQCSSNGEVTTPSAVITEQPKTNGYRFRYGCEGNTAGSILGANCTERNKTAPAIKLENVPPGSNVHVIVSCVTAVEPYRPHPHNLVGKNCSKGVCTVSLTKTNKHVFRNLGIQCTKKKAISESLKLREQIRVNPFSTDYYDPDYNYDMKKVRLAFQCFITDGQGCRILLEPMLSNPILDHKNGSELVICRMSMHCCQAKGCQEVWLMTEKISKDDIQVNVYEQDDTGQMIWDGWGDFSPNDVHKQYAIVFRMPAYKDQFLTQPKEVKIRLYRPSDETFSESKSFTYKPNDVDPHGINAKRKRRNDETGIPITPHKTQRAASNSSHQTAIRKMLTRENMANMSKPSATVTSAAQNTGIIPGVKEPFHTRLNFPSMPQYSSNQASYAAATAQPGTSNGLSATGIHYPVLKDDCDGAPIPNMEQLIKIPKAIPMVAQTSTSTPIPVVVDQLIAPPVMLPRQIPSVIDTTGQGHEFTQPTDQAGLQICQLADDELQDFMNLLDGFDPAPNESPNIGLGSNWDSAMLQTDIGGVFNKNTI